MKEKAKLHIDNKQKTTNSRKRTQIPPPPGPNDSCEVIDDYFSKYSFKDLDEAGHTRQLNKAEIAWVGKQMRLLSASLYVNGFSSPHLGHKPILVVYPKNKKFKNPTGSLTPPQ